MKVYCVSYDIRDPGKHYDKLYEELKKSPNWWHYLTSTWLIATNETSDQLAKRLISVIDKNDRLLVIRVVMGDSAGWLETDAWNWIQQFN